MPYKDKEKQKEYDRQRYLKNKEEMKEKGKKYYEEKREEKLKYMKEYNEKNKDKKKQYNREYIKNEKGKKSAMISAWKVKGLVEDDYDAIYDRYINTHECYCCKKPIHQGIGSRVMDHDH